MVGVELFGHVGGLSFVYLWAYCRVCYFAFFQRESISLPPGFRVEFLFLSCDHILNELFTANRLVLPDFYDASGPAAAVVLCFPGCFASSLRCSSLSACSGVLAFRAAWDFFDAADDWCSCLGPCRGIILVGFMRGVQMPSGCMWTSLAALLSQKIN